MTVVFPNAHDQPCVGMSQAKASVPAAASPFGAAKLTMRGSAAQFAALDGLPVRAPPQQLLRGAFRPPRQQVRHQQQWRQQLRLRCVSRATSNPTQRGIAMADESQPSAELDSLLACALPSPRYIKSGGAGAVVALAAHSESSSTQMCCY